jgi:ribosomal protein L11 methyltransferase
MSQNYVEVTIPAAVDSGELLGILRDGEALGAWEGDGVIHLYWPESRWSPMVLEELKQALSRLGAGGMGPHIRVTTLPGQDWNARWSMSLKPIRIGCRFRIRQSWNPSDPSFEGIELIIDPKRAFGTGFHATTQLILEWLEDHIRGGEHVLDIGTGTGILAMAALRLGAAEAVGIDNDPVAIECARENAAANSFGPGIEFRTGSLEDLHKAAFEIIVANLDRNTVLRLCDRLKDYLSPGGRVCLSGLQIEDFADIAGALATADGRIIERREREEWMALEVHFVAAENAFDCF